MQQRGSLLRGVLKMLKSRSKAMLKPESIKLSTSLCPRFDSCSAPVCPLDKNWEITRHLKGEPVCRWLRESMKNQESGCFSIPLTEVMAKAVLVARDELLSRKGDLKYRLERAASQGRKHQPSKDKESS
jgi:hypothetical protein